MSGYLLRYVAESRRQLPGKRLPIGQLTAKAWPQTSLRERALRVILQLFRASQVILALPEMASWRAFLWETGRSREAEQSTVHFSESQSTDREGYFLAGPVILNLRGRPPASFPNLRKSCCRHASVARPRTSCKGLFSNIRKHSRARNVFVRFARDQGQWKLTIDDDGLPG